MCVHDVHLYTGLKKLKESIGSPDCEIPDGYDHLMGALEAKLGFSTSRVCPLSC